jgi:hypothetical protein
LGTVRSRRPQDCRWQSPGVMEYWSIELAE